MTEIGPGLACNEIPDRMYFPGRVAMRIRCLFPLRTTVIPTSDRARPFGRLIPAFRAVAFAAAVASLVVGAARTASGADGAERHTRLLRSSPPNDSTLAAPPLSITLWYSSPVQLRLSRMRLTDGAGATITLSPPRLASDSATALIADVKGPMKPGSYLLSWTATSRDSHAIKGSFRFRVTGASASD